MVSIPDMSSFEGADEPMSCPLRVPVSSTILALGHYNTTHNICWDYRENRGNVFELESDRCFI